MGQTWQDLLFAHWRVPHELLRPHVPDRLELEQLVGSAWIGLTPVPIARPRPGGSARLGPTPFAMEALRLRGAPPLPRLSSFHELNCRTDVSSLARPFCWFF